MIDRREPKSRLEIKTHRDTPSNGSVTRETSALLAEPLLGIHEGAGPLGEAVTISVGGHFPPRLHVEATSLGEDGVDLRLPPRRNGSEITASHVSRDTVVRVVFQGKEISHKLKPTM